MKLFSLFVLLTLTPYSNLFAQQNEVVRLRSLYYDASSSHESAKSFYDKLSNVDESAKPILLGYKGMANFMLANHAKLPTSKLSYFIAGRDNLEKAIKIDPENLELRFLRFTVQTSAPRFLGYTKNIHDDKKCIWDALSKDKKYIDIDLRKRILKYLGSNQYCSAKEKKKIRTLQVLLAKEES